MKSKRSLAFALIGLSLMHLTTDYAAAQRVVTSPSGESLTTVEEGMINNLPTIASEAKAKMKQTGIVAATCPAGMDKACADALFLALVNTPAIKAISTTAQTTVLGNSRGSSFSLYAGRASQPAVNTGFSITKSTFYSQPKNPTNLWTGAFGELLLTNTSSLEAGIAAYTFLTNKTSAIGIAGAYAGASVEGWANGLFYCYLVVSGGVPYGICDSFADEGGW